MYSTIAGPAALLFKAHLLHMSSARSQTVEEVDFLSVANPALVLSFEEAERTFSLDKDCSLLELEGSSKESYSEETPWPTPATGTQDRADSSLNESSFTDICQCTLGKYGSPCSLVILQVQ